MHKTPPIAFIILIFAYAREGRLKGGSGKRAFMECMYPRPLALAHLPRWKQAPLPSARGSSVKPAPGKRLQTGHNERRLVAAPQSPARDVALPAFTSQQKALRSLQCMSRATSSLQAFPCWACKDSALSGRGYHS